MKLGKKTILGICLVLAGGIAAGAYAQHMSKCLAAGGGAEFLPPATMQKDEDLTLDLGLNTWGDNSCISQKYWQDDKPRGIFTNVQCHYRIKGETAYTAVKMPLIKDEVGDACYRASYRCVIPAQPERAGAELEYYVDYGWPETVTTLSQKSIPIQ